MDREAWSAIVHGVAKSWTWLSNWTELIHLHTCIYSFHGGWDGKESSCNAGDPVWSLGWKDSPREGNGHPLQCSCLENPRDRGAWWAAVHWVAQSRTRLKRLKSSSSSSSRILWELTFTEYGKWSTNGGSIIIIQVSVQFSCSVMSNSLLPHGLQHAKLPCPSPTPAAYSNSCPQSQWCHPTISSSAIHFSSCLQSFPALGSFFKRVSS